MARPGAAGPPRCLRASGLSPPDCSEAPVRAARRRERMAASRALLLAAVALAAAARPCAGEDIAGERAARGSSPAAGNVQSEGKRRRRAGSGFSGSSSERGTQNVAGGLGPPGVVLWRVRAGSVRALLSVAKR